GAVQLWSWLRLRGADHLGWALIVYWLLLVFFFQAEDGIRDRNVTGVQTCALPICPAKWPSTAPPRKPVSTAPPPALSARSTPNTRQDCLTKPPASTPTNSPTATSSHP